MTTGMAYWTFMFSELSEHFTSCIYQSFEYCVGEFVAPDSGLYFMSKAETIPRLLGFLSK